MNERFKDFKKLSLKKHVEEIKSFKKSVRASNEKNREIKREVKQQHKEELSSAIAKEKKLQQLNQERFSKERQLTRELITSGNEKHKEEIKKYNGLINQLHEGYNQKKNKRCIYFL